MKTASRTGRKKTGILDATQKSILRMFERGHSKHRTAAKLRINVHTLDAYVRVIYRTLKAHTMTAAVAKAIRMKLI